jgi:trigger factor
MRRMSYQVLARKYRPRNFEEMVGQEHVVQALSNALAQQRLHHAFLDAGLQALLDVTPIELPKSLIDMEIGRLMQQAREDMMQRGYGAQMKDMPLPRELFEEQAKRRVSLGLILAEVVEKHSLSATPEQVNALIAEQAESYENPQEVIDWYYASPERLDGPASVVLEDNVVAFVLSQAKVNEQAVPFEELMGNN